jgi:phage terminase large subunit-like protein
MRGPNLSGIWLDEASLMHEDAYKISIACLREGGEQGWLSATFTPKGPAHWTHRTFASKPKKPNTEIFRAPTDANPFLPKMFRETLQIQYGAGQFARQELGGEFVQMEGAEFPYELLEADGRWFQDWPDHIYQWIVALDPSKGQSDHPTQQMINRGRVGDWQAYTIIGLGAYSTFWIEADLARRSVIDMVKRGIELCCQFEPVPTLVVEDNDSLGMLYTEFTRQIQEGQKSIPLIAIRNSINKEMRIKRLGGYFAQKHERRGLSMRFRDTPGTRLLMAQLTDFPLGDFDDGPDSLELGMQHAEHLLNVG